MDVGTELRQARELAGLSREQVSQRTKIQIAKVEALEANAFNQLPQGVYLDGIIRAYAAEVGLDGNALAARLHVPASSIPTRHIDATAAYELDTLDADGVVEPLPAAHMAADHPVTATPPVHRARRRGGLTPVVAVLAVVAAFALGWKLYETSRPFPQTTSVTVPAVSDDAVRAGADADAGDAGADSAGTRGTNAAPAGSDASSDSPANTAAAPETAVGEEMIEGAWTLNTEVQSSSVTAYNGLRLGYRLHLEQDGNQVTGSGEKVSENGRRVGPSGRTPITVRGTVDGDQLQLTFTERGARRASSGTMTLQRDDDGALRGRFSSDAARSSGVAEALRQR